MSSREETLEKSRLAFEAAKRRMEKAQKAWQDEIDAIILRPVHTRSISRAEAVKLAKAIENDNCFKKIMDMGMVPEQIKEENEKIKETEKVIEVNESEETTDETKEKRYF